MNNYFTMNDDFEDIIKNTLNKDDVDLKLVSTGWTNIVYEVNTDNKNYFFRFPRDDFWSRTIVKDCEFAEFIKGKTDFETVNLQLKYHDGRPFSMHEKIEGVELADIMDKLTDYEVKDISSDIAKFMYQLHQIDIISFEKSDKEDIKYNLIDFLDELLVLHVSKEDMEFWKYDQFKNKEINCLVHGDLNSSNVLIGQDKKVKAFIDFGFGGYGNKYFDIARIIGRSDIRFKENIVNEYEKISNQNLDLKLLDEEINIWSNIDNAYINYMRKIGIYSD